MDELETKTQHIIENRLDRIRLRNFGDCKSIDRGVWELRIDYGPGYRIYFGYLNLDTIFLLIGGDKRSQSRDIKKAQQYWKEFKELYE